jgi:transcriptional regulator with XRE-family HTH domain
VEAAVRSPNVKEARSLGTALLVLRRAAGLSQRAIHDATGISKSNLSKYETGLLVPRLATLGRIMDALGLTMGDLYRAQQRAQVREELADKGDAAWPGRAAAVHLAQECGKAVAHCVLAFMELQAGGWPQAPTRGDRK